MPIQLRRIILVFSCFILLFLFLKNYLKDDSFGEFGHYRGDALYENSVQSVKYVDQATCNDCHQGIVDLVQEGLHDIVGCQICHGPGYLHIDTVEYTKLEIIDTREHCGTCHYMHPARPKNAINQIDPLDHNTDDDKCINCHNPHQPWLNLD